MRILKATTPIKYGKSTITSIEELARIIERDREQGWSLVNQGYEQSVCSISVPILSRTGQLIAAMCVVGTPIRTSPDKMIRRALPHLKQTAAKIWG
jgi:IclR family transcriptional regulator, pca regulon regulatory protein